MVISEIKIGNSIYFNNKVIKIDYYDLAFMSIIPEYFPIEYQPYQPIKVTKKLLLEIGFLDCRNWHEKNGVYVIGIADYFKIRYLNIEFRYLHELENVWFDIKKRELCL